MTLSVGSSVRVSSVFGDTVEYGKVTAVHCSDSVSVMYSDRHTDHEVAIERIMHLFDPVRPTEVVKGMRAECLFKDDEMYYPGEITEVRVEEDGSFVFAYDDGDVIIAVPSDLRQLPLLDDKRDSNMLPDNYDVRVGGKFNCKFGDEGFFPGVIHEINVDGSFVFYFDDGDVNSKVMRSDLRLCVVVDDAPVIESEIETASPVNEILNIKAMEAANKQDAEDDGYGDYEDDFIDDSMRETSTPAAHLHQSNSSLNVILGVPVCSMYDDEGEGVDEAEITRDREAFGKIDPVEAEKEKTVNFDVPPVVDTTHPLMRAGGGPAYEMTPRARLNDLCLEYARLQAEFLDLKAGGFNYKDAVEVNTGGDNYDDDSDFEQSNGFEDVKERKSQQQIVNSMTALKMRTLALSKMCYDGISDAGGEMPTLQSLREVCDLCSCYSNNGLYVQVKVHMEQVLQALEGNVNLTEVGSEEERLNWRNCAATLLRFFDAVRLLLTKDTDNSSLINKKELVKLVEDSKSVTTSNIVDGIDMCFSRIKVPSIELHQLIKKIRSTPPFKICINAVEASLDPNLLSIIKLVVADAESAGEGGEKSTDQYRSAASSIRLIRQFRANSTNFMVTLNNGIMEGLKERILSTTGDEDEGEDDDDDKNDVQVFYEELICLFATNAENEEGSISLLKLNALVMLGRCLSNTQDFVNGLATFERAKKLAEEIGVEDKLASCELLNAYGSALIAQWKEENNQGGRGGGGAGKKSRSGLTDALKFGNLDLDLDAAELNSNDTSYKGGEGIHENLRRADEMLTHGHDIYESCFGKKHVAVAGACVSIARLAILRGNFEESTEFFEKAFSIYREVHEKSGRKKGGCGLNAALVCIDLGRMKIERGEGEVGLGKIRFAAEYYASSNNKAAVGLFRELSRLYEKLAGCVDSDVVDCLESR